MSLMKFTVIDIENTISFVAPGNVLKALVAGCSAKPAPASLVELLERASKYDRGLQGYVMDGLAIFDEHYRTAKDETVQLDAHLEAELRALLKVEDGPVAGELEEIPAISLDYLLGEQEKLNGRSLSAHPVFRVIDETTRNESLQPVKVGLIIFNLRAKRIVQVQNSYGVLHRSDRGRYFENGQPTDRLYFYRLPVDWSLVP